MNQKTNHNDARKIQEDAQPDHLLKEYDLCWQGVAHYSTRTWMSASIFVSASIAALAWLATRPLATDNWAEFCQVTVIALVIALVLGAYLRIFRSWEVLDGLEFYRAEQIEQHLGLWRIRYRLRTHERPTSEKQGQEQPASEEESQRLDAMKQRVASRLGIKVQDLRRLREANTAFRVIIWLIIAGFLFSIARALLITLGLLN